MGRREHPDLKAPFRHCGLSVTNFWFEDDGQLRNDFEAELGALFGLSSPFGARRKTRQQRSTSNSSTKSNSWSMTYVC